jgi:hypothetical protein
VDIQQADSMEEGWRLWLEWQKFIAPGNLAEIQAAEADEGEYLGYLRCIARRRPAAKLDAIVSSLNLPYTPAPLLR